jgi:hypothetical protein
MTATTGAGGTCQSVPESPCKPHVPIGDTESRVMEALWLKSPLACGDIVESLH